MSANATTAMTQTTDQIIQGYISVFSKHPGEFLGVWLLALLGCTLFVGIMASQSTVYFVAFPNDAVYLKAIVGASIVFSLAHWIVIFLGAWSWYVTHFGDWLHVVIMPWTASIEPLMAQFGVLVAHIFFINRCYRLTNSNLFVGIGLAAVTSTSLVLFIILVAELFKIRDGDFLRTEQLILQYAVPALILNIIVDSAITGITIWHLSRSQKSGVNPNTRTALSRLIAVTWEAALPPAAMSVVNLAVFATTGKRCIIYIFPNVMIPRLYVFSLLYTLNSRITIKRTLEARPGQTRQRINAQPDLGGLLGKVRQALIGRGQLKTETISVWPTTGASIHFARPADVNEGSREDLFEPGGGVSTKQASEKAVGLAGSDPA